MLQKQCRGCQAQKQIFPQKAQKNFLFALQFWLNRSCDLLFKLGDPVCKHGDVWIHLERISYEINLSQHIFLQNL